MRGTASDDCARRDFSARADSFLAVWGAPIAAAGLLSLPIVPAWVTAAAWSAAFVWMGGACLINARRCGRVHCFVSGPILLLGAAFAAAIALEFVHINAVGFAGAVAATLALSALSYVFELVWGRYAGAGR